MALDYECSVIDQPHDRYILMFIGVHFNVFNFLTCLIQI